MRGKLAAAQGLTQMAIDYLDRASKTDPVLLSLFISWGCGCSKAAAVPILPLPSKKRQSWILYTLKAG